MYELIDGIWYQLIGDVWVIVTDYIEHIIAGTEG
jgi:hypothetical protein